MPRILTLPRSDSPALPLAGCWAWDDFAAEARFTFHVECHPARQVAQRLQTMMHASGQWREKSEKKKPEKDDPYQMTLVIQAALRLA